MNETNEEQAVITQESREFHVDNLLARTEEVTESLIFAEHINDYYVLGVNGVVEIIIDFTNKPFSAQHLYLDNGRSLTAVARTSNVRKPSSASQSEALLPPTSPTSPTTNLSELQPGEVEEVEEDNKYIKSSPIQTTIQMIHQSEESDFFFIMQDRLVIETRGQRTVQSITLRFTNTSTSQITLTAPKLLQSKDISAYQIVDILTADSASMDVITANATFTSSSLTQYLRTNVMAKVILTPTDIEQLTGKKLNFIEISDYSIRFRQALLGGEVEHFKLNFSDDIDGSQQSIEVFHAVSENHELRGRAFTTVNPRVRYPKMSELEYEKFKLMVAKEDTFTEPFSIRFQERGKNKELTPILTLGVGVDDKNDLQNPRGRMQMMVEDDKGIIRYTNKKGEESAVTFGQNGMSLENVYNSLTKLERYDNGLVAHFQNDEKPTTILFAETEITGELAGIVINGELVEMPIMSGNVPIDVTPTNKGRG